MERRVNQIIDIQKDTIFYWQEKGLILYPKYLLKRPLKMYNTDSISILREHMNIEIFQDITESTLRLFAAQAHGNLSKMMMDLYVLGFRFRGSLGNITASRLPNTIIDDEKKIVVTGVNEDLQLKEVMSRPAAKRFMHYGFEYVHELNHLLLPSISWILGEKEEETVIQWLRSLNDAVVEKHLYIPNELWDVALKPKSFPKSELTIHKVMENGIHTFGELSRHFHRIEQFQGIGKKKIATLLEDLGTIIQRELDHFRLLQMTDEERLSVELERFEAWVEQQEGPKQSRYWKLIIKRFNAAQRDEHLTLEQLGTVEGLTRERIRQILKQGDKQLAQKWDIIMKFLAKRLSLEKIIDSHGIIKSEKTAYILSRALETRGIYCFDIQSMVVITRFSPAQLEEYFSAIENGMKQAFHLKVFTEEELLAYCETLAMDENISLNVMHAIMTMNVMRTPTGKVVLKDISKADLVELVLLQYPEGVNVYQQEQELIERANQIIPQSFAGARSFNPILTREEVSERFALWGRGIYIHRSYVTDDRDWVHSVGKLALTWLASKDFIHVAKLYDEVKVEAIKRRVPNEYALYSLLRFYNEGELALSRFPIILIEGVERVDNREWILKFMREKKRPVSIGELIATFVERKGWKRFTLEYNLTNSPEIISFEHGSYTLLENYDSISEMELKHVVREIHTELQEHPVLYLRSFFQERKADFVDAGLETAHVTYAVLKSLGLDGIQFPKFPFIVSDDFEGEYLAAQHLVEGYIKKERRIVAREEVIVWLREQIGADSRTLDFALLRSDDILYYSAGQYGEYVHRETIGLTNLLEDQIIEQMVRRYEQITRLHHRAYVLLEELYQSDELPKLANDTPWSKRLLGDLLRKHDQWNAFGSYGEILLPVYEAIQSETDLIAHLLQYEFQGIAPLSTFKRFLLKNRYSSNGEFLKETRTALQKDTAPFAVVGDQLVIKRFANAFGRTKG